MKVTIYNKPNPSLNAKEQILVNRGIKFDDIPKYLNSNIKKDVNSYKLFGEDALNEAATALLTTIYQNGSILVIQDCDVDGMTSAATIINYLHDLFPTFVENHLDYYIHEKKIHGLSDCVDIAKKYDLVLIPDASSNDYKEHEIIVNNGGKVLVLDHHQAPKISENAIVINNQLSDYPNKSLSGVGVTYQFCKYLDELLGEGYADNYLDLVAIGNQADMMSGLSIETKTFIFEGLKDEHLKNPFIYAMSQKNSFSLTKADYKPYEKEGLAISPIGASFFIIPLMNAICRSGTIEEKTLVFESMLKYKAFEKIPSNKRGHKIGDMETRLEQAARTCTNVKNRQEREVKAAMEKLEELIEKDNMMEHKVLLFKLKPGEIGQGIAGLVANKIMAKYQRCCAVLTEGTTRIEEELPEELIVDDAIDTVVEKKVYMGSMRAYSASGLDNFKDVCENSSGCFFVAGHQSAAGLGVYADEIEDFLKDTDDSLKDLPNTPSYHVDYIWEENQIESDKIIEISEMNSYIMQDMPRSYVCVKNIYVDNNNLTVMAKNTLKIQTPNMVFMKFAGTEDEIEKLQKGVTIQAICKCNKNEWMGSITPQLIIEDYEINVQKSASMF